MTPKEKKERRRLWWKERYQAFRLWLWCVAGIGVVLILPGLKNGIAGISAYVPSPLEIGVALGAGFIAVLLDEGLGGDKLAKTKSAYNRKRKHAIMAGLGVLGILERLLGG